jgi:hypothetical protein
MRIFPKCYIPYINQLLTNLEKHNAKSIVTIDDFNKTLHWPKYFQPDNRPAKLTTYGDFKLNYSTYKQLFPNLFLKTVKKGLHIKNLKYGQENNKFYTKPSIIHIYDNTEIILSQMYDNIIDTKNNTNKKEYRIFVVNGQLYSISRAYVDNPIQIPQYVLDYAYKKISDINKTDFVKSYVLDIVECVIDNKQVVDIIEANPICCAGLEVSNDLLNPITNNLYKPTM